MLNFYPANEDTTGALFEITGGWAAQTRWQRAGGHGFPINKQLTPEDVASKWKIIGNFGTFVVILMATGAGSYMDVTFFFPDDGRATNPSSTQEAIAQVCSRIPAPGVTLPLGIVIGLFRGSHLNSFTTHHI